MYTTLSLIVIKQLVYFIVDREIVVLIGNGTKLNV